MNIQFSGVSGYHVFIAIISAAIAVKLLQSPPTFIRSLCAAICRAIAGMFGRR